MKSTYPCSAHGHRVDGKLASVYWAWFNARGDRVAYKMRYCRDCIERDVVELLRNVSDAADDELVCSCYVCGGDASDDLDPVYATIYLPGQEPRPVEFVLDGACAARIRGPIVDKGIRLGDRPQRYQPPDDSWGMVAVPSR